MQHSSWLVGLAVVALSIGCKKDSVAPTAGADSRTVDVRFLFHAGGVPLAPGAVSRDGFGTLVRFSTLRFALAGVHALGDQGQEIGSWPDVRLTGDLSTPTATVALDKAKGGVIHWVDCAPGMLAAGVGTNNMVLEMTGTVDIDRDGVVNDDAVFRICCAAPSAVVPLRIHTHADVSELGGGALYIAVDVEALLHDIDLPDHMITDGEGIYATQALENLTTLALGDGSTLPQ